VLKHFFHFFLIDASVSKAMGDKNVRSKRTFASLTLVWPDTMTNAYLDWMASNANVSHNGQESLVRLLVIFLGLSCNRSTLEKLDNGKMD